MRPRTPSQTCAKLSPKQRAASCPRSGYSLVPPSYRSHSSYLSHASRQFRLQTPASNGHGAGNTSTQSFSSATPDLGLSALSAAPDKSPSTSINQPLSTDKWPINHRQIPDNHSIIPDNYRTNPINITQTRNSRLTTGLSSHLCSIQHASRNVLAFPPSIPLTDINADSRTLPDLTLFIFSRRRLALCRAESKARFLWPEKNGFVIQKSNPLCGIL